MNSYEEVKEMFTTDEILAELKSDNDQSGSYAPVMKSVPDWKKGEPINKSPNGSHKPDSPRTDDE